MTSFVGRFRTVRAARLLSEEVIPQSVVSGAEETLLCSMMMIVASVRLVVNTHVRNTEGRLVVLPRGLCHFRSERALVCFVANLSVAHGRLAIWHHVLLGVV